MFRRENITGILLLLLCGVVAGIMITAIITGRMPNIPDSLRMPVTILGIGLMLVMLYQRFGSRFRR